MTTGPSNGDYWAAGSQKTETLHHAADVLRKLINKLPDKDAEKQLDEQKTFEKPINFNVESTLPFKSIPASINNLPLESITQLGNSGFSSSQPQPPPGADPDAYKVYRAMALKLAGAKPVLVHNKKPYLVLSDNGFKQVNSRPFLATNNNHIQQVSSQQFSHGPNQIHSIPQQTHHLSNPGPKNPNFEIQKTIQYEFNEIDPNFVINSRNNQAQ